MRRMPSGFVSAVVAVVLVLVTAAACGGGGGKPSHPAATTADVPVTVAHGATVRLAGGTTLVIPPGAVSADGRLIAHAGGSQVGTNLGLDGRPGAAKPVFASAGSAVTFELTGAKLVHPAALTVQVDPAAFAQAGTAANRPNAAWLAFYDAAAHRWQHVDSRYDPATHSVTAQVPHLSTWNPFTWDWAGITLRLRQSLSAFGSGRAPATGCPKVQGISLTTAGGNDPPLIACITGDAASGFKVEVTNNRAYSAILQAPPGLSQEPRDYAGFEEFVQSRDSVTKALGGPYLASVGKVTYDLPATGTTFVFKDAASGRTVLLDMSVAAAMAVFDRVTLGYGSCILDAVAHSGAATLNEAPGLVDECFPKLIEGIAAITPGLGWIATAAQAVGLFIQEALISGDYIFDVALKNHGEVDITRAPSTLVPVAYEPGYSHGNQVYSPEIRPGEFQIWLSPAGGPGTFMTSLTWSRWDSTEAVGSGNFQSGSVTGSIVLSRPAEAADGILYYSELTISDGQSIQYNWSWSAKEWIKQSPTPPQPLPTCPNSAQLLSAWNAAPAAVRDSWAGVQITGFNYITCWNGWVVAQPISPSPGNGVIVFSLAGNLHLITTAELNQQFTQEVCSSPNAPPSWKVPPLISCS